MDLEKFLYPTIHKFIQKPRHAGADGGNIHAINITVLLLARLANGESQNTTRNDKPIRNYVAK